MAHYSDPRFGDPFIAKREMPGTNVQMVRRRTLKYIAFLNATSGARAAYRRSMNYTAKIQAVV
jgi:hypothetical protein